MAEPFVPTHEVPDEGMSAWREPDPNQSPVATLDPGLEVRRAEQREDGWAHIVCSNDWDAWVDGRRLVALEHSVGRGDDGLVGELNAALVAYQRLIDDHEAGRLDDDAFHRQALKTALIVRDTDAWLLDLASERWWRYDGVGLSSVAIPTTGPPAQV